MSMRGRDAYERGDPSLRGSGGSGRGSRTVDRIPSHSHSTPTDLALARPPLPLKLSAPFSYSSLRLILTAHRYSLSSLLSSHLLGAVEGPQHRLFSGRSNSDCVSRRPAIAAYTPPRQEP